ncbi:hypothetical protein [Pedobacter sp.]|uniref:hypothetical protein n=1 Tax=Pedobacter sp. TaxID=1411316 RepID=UPI003BAAF100
MNSNNDILISLIIGLASITFIDSVGAMLSRKMQFKYTYLSIISFMVYIAIGYVVSINHPLIFAMVINAFLGFYDATIGMKLSLIFKANILEPKIDMQVWKVTLSMVVTAIFLALIGHLIRNWF